MHATPQANGPLRSLFPGELALRDLSPSGPAELASLAAARLLVLQLAERYAADAIERQTFDLELHAVKSYLGPIGTPFPLDALRLEQLLDRMAEGADRRVVQALLSTATSAEHHSHDLSAYGFLLAAYTLGTSERRNDAGALSAAARLRDLAAELGRDPHAQSWQRRVNRLIDRCG